MCVLFVYANNHGLQIHLKISAFSCVWWIFIVPLSRIKGNIKQIKLRQVFPVAYRRSEQTKQWRGTALFTNNTVPLQCFVYSERRYATGSSIVVTSNSFPQMGNLVYNSCYCSLKNKTQTNKTKQNRQTHTTKSTIPHNHTSIFNNIIWNTTSLQFPHSECWYLLLPTYGTNKN